MKRYAEDKKVIAKRRKFIDEFQHGQGRERLTEGVWRDGCFRKRRPLDCGRPRCGICHEQKRFGHEETRQEKLSAMKMND